MNEILSHYAEIITDPAHSLVELTFTLVVDVVFLGAVWPWVKRHIHRDISQAESDVDGTPLVVREDGLYLGNRRLLTSEEFEDRFHQRVSA